MGSRRKQNRRQLPDRRDVAPLNVSQTNAYLQLNQQTSFYTGPVLPNPAELEAYNGIIPNGAERIFDWVVKQSENRMSMERGVVFSNIEKEARGQWMGFSISVIVLAIGGILVYTGAEKGGGFAMIVTMLTWLAGTFITSKVKGHRELMRKQQELAERKVVEPT
jgi:uncharacterized membrane protein